MRAICILLLAGLAACGDGSGLDPGERLVSLDAREVAILCDWMTDTWGGEGHVRQCTWNDGQVVEYALASTAECIANPPPQGCTATVDDVHRCFRYYSGNLCTATQAQIENVCAPVFACHLMGN